MISLLGHEEMVKNIYKLSIPYTKSIAIKTLCDLWNPYREFLTRFQPHYPVNFSQNPIIIDRDIVDKLIPAFGVSSINDLYQENMIGEYYGTAESPKKVKLIEKALDRLCTLDLVFGNLFKLVVHSIIIVASDRNNEGSSAHGGTSSKAIGLIWLNVKDDATVEDILEMLIHEFTHSLVFLDEHNYGHFYYERMHEQSTWAMSAILSRKRPMDKVIHSIFVSSEILLARNSFLANGISATVHPSSPILRDATLASIQSVISLKDKSTMQSRVFDLLDIVKNKLEKLG